MYLPWSANKDLTAFSSLGDSKLKQIMLQELIPHICLQWEDDQSKWNKTTIWCVQFVWLMKLFPLRSSVARLPSSSNISSNKTFALSHCYENLSDKSLGLSSCLELYRKTTRRILRQANVANNTCLASKMSRFVRSKCFLGPCQGMKRFTWKQCVS